jgi:hypothetical protein
MQKCVSGKQLWNYDNLEPHEKKIVSVIILLTKLIQGNIMSEKDDKYNLGKSFIFPKEVMNDIHIKSDLGRYRMRGFSLFKKDSNMG